MLSTGQRWLKAQDFEEGRPILSFVIDESMIELTSEKIDYCRVTESVRSHTSGAVVLFLGTVREMTEGRRTVALDYDAYPQMAKAKLAELEADVRNRWSLDGVAIVHRLGHLELGEISVAVAVSSPHRREAFEAGQYLIDRLKQVVPIWKKENWKDGTSEWIHPGMDGAVSDGYELPLADTQQQP